MNCQRCGLPECEWALGISKQHRNYFPKGVKTMTPVEPDPRPGDAPDPTPQPDE